jgi:hypothetical protein
MLGISNVCTPSSSCKAPAPVSWLTVKGRLPLQSWPYFGGLAGGGLAGSLRTGAGGNSSSGSCSGSCFGSGGGLQEARVASTAVTGVWHLELVASGQ